MTKFVVNPYDPSDLPCALCSPDAQEAGQEPRTEGFGKYGYSESVIERMVALVAKMASRQAVAKPGVTHFMPRQDYDEARAIMEAMMQVETDEQRVQRIWQDWIDGKSNTGSVKSVIALALAEGRQLQREGRS